MPPRPGKTDLRVEIDADVTAQMERLTASGRTKREIVEAALRAYADGDAHEAMLTTVQRRLDALTDRLDTLETTVAALLPTLTEMLITALQPLETTLRQVRDGQTALQHQYHTQILTTMQLLNDEIGAVKARVVKRGVLW